MHCKLKLRWARFFTLAGWQWSLSERPGFDFEVSFACGFIDCEARHALLVRVCDKPVAVLELKHAQFERPFESPLPALFGDGPANTFWTMVHGSGGGAYSVEYVLGTAEAAALWKQASNA